jgi:hypothetical protein
MVYIGALVSVLIYSPGIITKISVVSSNVKTYLRTPTFGIKTGDDRHVLDNWCTFK